jgi:plasmid stabilization system protein ParE
LKSLVPEVRFSERALADIERIFEFLAERDPFAARRAGEAIIDATAVLQRHPMIGRPVEGNLRELVISRGRSGYAALYRFSPETDAIEVLAIRHQCEAGYR